MGNDNHSRELQARYLKRKQATRKSYDRILIVCEGSKTEPSYFNEIRQHYRLHTASIKVLPSQYGTSPKQIVDFAYDLFKNGDTHLHIKAGAFEQVYAVFDRDEHQSYHDALQYAATLNNKKLRNDQKNPIIFQAMVSVPNFELWFLLHFKFIRHRIDREDVIRQLKQHIIDYEKGKDGYFKKTRHLLDKALSHAAKLVELNDQYDGQEPYTDIGKLVQLLTTLNP